MRSQWLALALTLSLVPMANAQNPEPTAPAAASSVAGEDPFLWLEPIHGDKAMGWVTAENAVTTARFAGSDEFIKLQSDILEVLDSEEQIPWVSRHGEYLYNFWQDSQHRRGLWRRTTLEEFRKDQPDWEVLLDIDALNKAEDKSWVFKGAQCLEPEYDRCLVSLSPDGGDAVTVREFDISDKAFVDGGFQLPAAKTSVDWIDRDHLFVGTDFGPGSMTESTYPRLIKRWTRGTPLAEAELVYEGTTKDLGVFAWHDNTPGFERSFVQVATDFYHGRLYQIIDGKSVRVEVQDDANAAVHRDWLLVETRSPWATGGKTWPAGALLAIRYDDFMAGKRDFTALFTPDPRTALSSYSWTRHHLILNVLDDVKSRLEVLTPTDHGWNREPLAAGPALTTVRIADTDPLASDEYWLSVSGYVTPPSLKRGVIGGQDAETIKHEPAFFDAAKVEVSQHFVESKDGTRIPYFEVAPKDLELDGTTPTILYGYGGFEVSLLPSYSGKIGRAWLDKGGVWVVANIRGGGEYGPEWHKAALKANRHKAYEDFAAVARDLAARGVTSPEHLGAMGGSNGGLLVGNMLTQYPELFGAISCGVPLLDMKRYIYLNAGASWMGEYGNPEDPEQWKFIQTFSPYHNVDADTDYPPVLFTTATSDDRVGPSQARKMTARMQKMGIEDVWFYENTEGGHGGAADSKQSAYIDALEYSFLWRQLQ